MAKRRSQNPLSRNQSSRPPQQAMPPGRLLADIHGLIEQARMQVARTINSAMAALYWQIGKRIHEDVLHEKRAEYGEQIVATLSKQLEAEYGRGFSQSSLSRMVKFAECFPKERDFRIADRNN